MTDILIRNYAQFWMQLDLDQLHNYPLDKWERICAKLLTLDINMATNLRLRAWFPAAIVAAEEAAEAAIVDEEKMWTDTTGLRFGRLKEAKDYNRALQQRTRAALSKVKKLKARCDVFKHKTNFMED